MAGFGGAACAKETFTTTTDGLSETVIEDSPLVVETQERGTDASWCRLTRTFKDFTVKRTLVGPRLTMSVTAPGAYAAAMNVTINSGVVPGVIGLDNEPWISAAVQPLIEDGKRLIHFAEEKADAAVATKAVSFEFEFNGLVFDDKPNKKKAQHFTTLSRGASLRVADLAPAEFSEGRGYLAVSIDIEKNRNYNLVVHQNPPGPTILLTVVLALVGTLVSVLITAMNTVEAKQDPSQIVAVLVEDSAKRLDSEVVSRSSVLFRRKKSSVASPGIEMATAEGDNEGQPSEGGAFPSAPSAPSDEENDIEEQWYKQQQKQDGAARPHAASVHDLK